MNKENLKKMVMSLWMGIAIVVLFVLMVVLLIESALHSNMTESKCMSEVERIGSVIEDHRDIIDRMITVQEGCVEVDKITMDKIEAIDFDGGVERGM